MSAAGFAQHLLLTRFSQPARDRALYRAVRPRKVRRIVEIGVGNGQRAENLISLALRYHDVASVKYTGIDLFEAHPEPSESTCLKEVHRRLHGTGVTVRLVPGTAAEALPRCAHHLRGTDWVIVARDEAESLVHSAWHFLPRMLHQHSEVWIESPDGAGFQLLSAREVSQQMAERSQHRKVA